MTDTVNVSGDGDVNLNDEVGVVNSSGGGDVNVTGDGPVTIEHPTVGGGIPVYTDPTLLPTDGSVLLAWLEYAGGMQLNNMSNLVVDRILVSFVGDPNGLGPYSFYSVGSTSDIALPTGWLADPLY